MDEEKNPSVSRFNEASFNLQRLHNCWVNCAKFRSNGQYDKWKWELDTVWSELCQDVTEDTLPKEHEDIEDENRDLRDAIGEAGKNRQQLYEELSKRQIFLRRLQNKVGKGGSYDDGSGEEFE